MKIYFLASREEKTVLKHWRFITHWRVFSDQITIRCFMTNRIFHLLIFSSATLPLARKEGWKTAISWLLNWYVVTMPVQVLTWSDIASSVETDCPASPTSLAHTQPYPLTSAKAPRCSEEDSHSGHQTSLAHLQQLEKKTGRRQRCPSYTETHSHCAYCCPEVPIYTGFHFHIINFLVLWKD